MCKVNTILFRRSLFLKKKERKEERKKAGRTRRREDNCLSKSSFTCKILYFIIKRHQLLPEVSMQHQLPKKKKKPEEISQIISLCNTEHLGVFT